MNTTANQSSERTQKLTNEVLETLDRWSEKFEGHQTEKRGDTRKRFRGPITICVRADRSDGLDDPGGEFQVTARNLSSRGLSFVHSTSLDMKHILVCLGVDSQKTLCLRAEIVRSREVHNGFWEYGVSFIGRADG